MDIPALLGQLQSAAATAELPPATLAQWRRGFAVGGDTFSSAVAAGMHAGQLAFVFAGGYQSALRQLVPGLPAGHFAALLLSEGRHQRPEELRTTLTPRADGTFQLDGEKSYVTGGAAADTLLVVARQGTADDGRARVAVALLPGQAPGVEHIARSDAAFLPELPHGRARFAGVQLEAAALLPGDGWRDYARPFRTIEDIHVSAAVAAHLAVAALRRKYPESLLASLLACLARLETCARLAPQDAAGHVLLAGAERELQQITTQINELVAEQHDEFARDWRANHLLVALAAPARGARLQKAFSSLRGGQ